MIKTIALAGAAAVLVLGSMAVAQTTQDQSQTPTQTQSQTPAQNQDQNANPSGGAMNNDSSQAAPSADQSGANASTTAGERG